MYLLDKHLPAGVGRVLERCDFVPDAYSSSVEDPTAQPSLVDERFTNAVLFEMPFEIRTRLTEFGPEAHGVTDLESSVDEMGERDPFGRDIPPMSSGLEINPVVTLDRGEGLRLD
jgi:hypothetical protein